MTRTLAIYLATAGAALAHPGHGTLEGAAHWAFSPLHGLGVIALAAVLWGLQARRKE